MTRSAPTPIPSAIATVCALVLVALCGCVQSGPRVGSQPEPIFYPLPPAPARIAYVTSIHDETAVGFRPNRLARFLFGHDTETPKTITKPFGLAAAGTNLFVCDTQQGVVHVLDFQQRLWHRLPAGGPGATGRGQLLKPVAVTLDDQANRYVVDTVRRQVVVFSPDNEAVRVLGPPVAPASPPVAPASPLVAPASSRWPLSDEPRASARAAGARAAGAREGATGGSSASASTALSRGIGATDVQAPAPARPFKPVCVAFHDGRLYVLNAALHRVEVLDPVSGELLDAFGEKGTEPGQMLFPNGVAVDPTGRVYVTDLLNCRVQVFSSDGRLVRGFGRAGDHAGEFSRPKHLAVGPDGLVYVVDAAFQRVQMFDGEGRILMLFGGPGGDGRSMTLPGGICVNRSLLPFFADRIPEGFDADYLIFVSQQFGPRKIEVYAFGRLRGEAIDVSGTGLAEAGRPTDH